MIDELGRATGAGCGVGALSCRYSVLHAADKVYYILRADGRVCAVKRRFASESGIGMLEPTKRVFSVVVEVLKRQVEHPCEHGSPVSFCHGQDALALAPSNQGLTRDADGPCKLGFSHFQGVLEIVQKACRYAISYFGQSRLFK